VAEAGHGERQPGHRARAGVHHRGTHGAPLAGAEREIPLKRFKSASDAAGARRQTRKYLAAAPPETRRRLKLIRDLVRRAAPYADEVFSYGIPGFKISGRPFVWYAAFAHHISLYPMTGAIRRAHAKALKGYKMSTGTVQFPLDKPLPIPLIKKLIRARAAEVRHD
jgi:uncharacterized protein YdhG (YjbR/CyaY superfamily)